MPQANDDQSVRNNPERGRFELDVEGHVCLAEYELQPGTIVFTHTEVPPEVGGRGLGAKLVKAGLEYARSEQLQVIPQCTFVARFMQRHPETHDLVHPEHRGKIGI